MYNHNELNQRLVLIDDLICVLDGTGRQKEAAEILRQLQAILLDHFDYEEHCILTPVLAAITTGPLILTVLQIAREHGEMTATLARLSRMLEEGEATFSPAVEHRMIGTLGSLKPKIARHAKLEERTIVPLIKNNSAIRKGIRLALQAADQGATTK